MHSVYDSNASMDGGMGGAAGQYTTGSVTAVLESELKRAKLLVGDMQRQRQELGQAVRQLTAYGESNGTLSHSDRHHQMDEKHHHQEQHQQQGQQESDDQQHSQSKSSKHKRSFSSSWVETDLDSTGGSKDGQHHRTLSSSSSSVLTIDDEMQSLFLPSQASNNNSSSTLMAGHKYAQDGDGSMDELYSGGGAYSYGAAAMAGDKQEIKTVRIVKRESERRMRDKEKNDRNIALSLDQVLEEEAQLMEDYQRSRSLPRGYETHELFVHNQDTRGSIGGPSPMDGSGLMSDYYSSVAASANGTSYPVSLIDRQADLYTGHFEPSLQSKYVMNGSSDGGSDLYHQQQQHQLQQQPHPQYTSGASSMSTSLGASGLKRKTESIQSLTNASAELGPVFQSEAAKQIINEMAATGGGPTNALGDTPSGDSAGSSSGGEAKGISSEQQQQAAMQRQRAETQARHRRAVPKDKRRHHTAPHHVNAKSIELMHSENDMNKNNVNWRARDDVDLEVTIRPRSNAPDVVRSALGPREKISEHTIDKLLAAPSKILIPERYVPEQTPELSPEEKRRRQEKVEAIKKMLSDTPIGSGANEPGTNPAPNAEKKQREHLIQLNQILAQQVMQMSKIVAENSSAVLPSKIKRTSSALSAVAAANSKLSHDEKDHYESDLEDYDTDSPAEPLPLYQQRENYFT
ncbi:hypothetical protein AND_001424 [Anopheles darlingi]|uniref:Uncharacterized protein n=1 Tax=Anopheles darlingi TaxID=43151 RepID=W5JRM9_ANODA|nr:hypothetical protein AND_001424 [Anopheles darlingi]